MDVKCSHKSGSFLYKNSNTWCTWKYVVHNDEKQYSISVNKYTQCAVLLFALFSIDTIN